MQLESDSWCSRTSRNTLIISIMHGGAMSYYLQKTNVKENSIPNTGTYANILSTDPNGALEYNLYQWEEVYKGAEGADVVVV